MAKAQKAKQGNEGNHKKRKNVPAREVREGGRSHEIKNRKPQVSTHQGGKSGPSIGRPTKGLKLGSDTHSRVSAH